MTIGIVSGSKNCLPLLQFLKANNINPELYTNVKNTDGHDFEIIHHYCKAVHITVEDSSSLHEWYSLKKPDFIFVLGYNQLINVKLMSPELLAKTFNIHFGALPQYKGPSPLFWQIKSGDENVALSIHHINEKYDDGAVVWTKQIPYETHFSYGFLELLFSQMAIEGVVSILNHHLQKTEMAKIEIKQSIAKYYPKPQLNDIKINWQEMSVKEIQRLVNACNPWNKGATTFYNGNEVKIIDIEILAGQHNDNSVLPGTIIQHQGCLQVKCKDNAIVNLNMLNINGTFLPARHASNLGLCSGGIFTDNH